jgi:GntR family transcriptional regulator
MLRDKTIPLYYQLETILRRKILSGELAPHSLLPSEESLAVEYSVSRITVRQALGTLEKDGLILRQRGRGTFVSEKAKQFDPQRFIGSIEDLLMMNTRTTFEVLSSVWTDPPKDIKERLSGKVLQVQKLRKINNEPFSHVYNYLPLEIGEKLPMDLIATKPMLMILEENLGIRPVEADQVVSASLADAEIAGILRIRAGDPLLKAQRVVYDENGRIVEFVHVLYRADKYSFAMKLKRNKTGGKMKWNPI